MKGFFAVIHKNNQTQTSLRQKLEQGADYLLHRGKYKQYFYHSDTSIELPTLGMVSLSSSENKITCFYDVLVVFDGKIANKQEIISSYSDINTSNTDEEIIAYLYKLSGVDAFRTLELYGSIFLFDIQKQQVLTLRDSFGTKPLYYYLSDDFIAISSETRPIYKLFNEAKYIDTHAVTDFLLWGDIAKHTQIFFTNIVELKPSHFISYSLNEGVFSEKSYYTLPFRNCLGRYDRESDKKAVKNVKDLFTKGIISHLSDVDQLAIGLSGGLDSSAIACVSRSIHKDLPITTFTAVNEFDEGESYWAKKIATHIQSNHINVYCTAEQLINECEQVCYAQNLPLFNTSSFAQYKVMEAVRQAGFDSMMDGQGSDELFGGYTYYFSKMMGELFSEWMFKEGFRFCKNLSNANLSWKLMMQISLKEYLKNDILPKKIVATATRKELLNCLHTEAKQEYFAQKKIRPPYKETLNEYLYESYTSLLPHALHWVEHSAAHFGVDCIMPFADNKALAECVFDVSSIYKLHQGWGKYMLRFAMQGIVPDEVRLRKQKLGFYTPENQWLDVLSGEIKDRVLSLTDVDNVIDKNTIEKQWNKLYIMKNQNFKAFAFRCMSYLLWRNQLD